MGAARGKRVVVQRDRMAGRLRIALASETDDGARLMAWKRSKNSECATLFVPLKDVAEIIQAPKPAQTCRYEVGNGELIIKLPTWACPPVQMPSAARPAIPLRESRA